MRPVPAVSFRLLILQLFIFVFLVPISHALDAGFLEESLNSDGSISRSTDLSTVSQSTAESLITIDEIGGVDSITVQVAQTYLSDLGEAGDLNTETLSYLLLTNSSSRRLDDVAELYRRQNIDGGLGAYVNYDSDLISTSAFLRVLNQTGVVNEISSGAVAYLIAQQNQDGGWSLKGNNSQVETTSMVVNALWLYRKVYRLGSALDDGISFLSYRKGSSNLWESIESSALALSSILNVELERDNHRESLDAFAGLQNSNGSFEGDVYLTALGLRVLDAVSKPAPDQTLIAGRVVDGDSGFPLSGAAVELSGVSSYSGFSDANGEFEIGSIAAGNYELLVSNEGFSSLGSNIVLTVGDKISFGDIQLSRLEVDPETGEPVTTGMVRGVVTEALLKTPLSGVTVSIEGTNLVATTSEDGAYQINSVPLGVVQIVADAEGYSSVSGSANLQAGQTLVFSPSMRELVPLSASLKGVITDYIDGSSLSGVLIEVTDSDGLSQTVMTGPDGSYSIDELLTGDIDIEATLEGYYPLSSSVNVEPGTRLIFSPQMTLLSQGPDTEVPTSTFTGTFVDAVSGKGIEGVEVVLTDLSTGELVTVITGSDGDFLFEDLTIGSAGASIESEKVGYRLFSGTVDIPAGLNIDVGTLELQPDTAPMASISGFVTDVRSRQFMNGAIISVRNLSSNALTEVMSDNQGEFSLTGLNDGEYEVKVSYSDYNTSEFNIYVSAGMELDLGEIKLRQPGVDALLADMAITELDISQLQSNQSDFSVSGSVSGVMVNRGNAIVSQSINVIAFEDLNRDGEYTDTDIHLGSSIIDAVLDVDSSLSFSVDVSGMQSFRDAPITVMLDANNVVAELSEANNTKVSAGLCTRQSQGPSLDLALCMDGSGSVSNSEFQLQLEGTAQAIENEEIVPRDGSVRVSAIQFSSSSSVHLEPTIIEEDNVESVADAIRSIYKRGGGTSIHSCIASATSLLNDSQPESLIQVIDVSTDGQSNYSAAVNASSNAAGAGIDVLNSIGVGNGIDNSLLNAIVFPQPSGGDRGFVINVDGYQEYIDGISTKISLETKIPDLTLGGLVLSDGGSTLSASMVIGNAGSGNVGDPYIVNLYNSEGILVAEQTVTQPLSSGESIPVTVTGIDASNLTSGTLVAEVSSSNGFAECNSDNNRQEVSVPSLSGDIQLSLNAMVFSSNSDVSLMTSVTNTGVLVGNYVTSLRVLDDEGVVIFDVASFDINDLAAGDSTENNYTWNTGLTLSGNYVADAILFNAEGGQLSTDTIPFMISELQNGDGSGNGVAAATARAATDRLTYHIDDIVTLDALVKNVTSIHTIDDPLLILEVFAPDNSEIYREEIPLNSLVAGQIVERTRPLALLQAAEGTYQYRVILSSNGSEYAVDSTSFEVVNDLKAAIRGNIEADLPELYIGEVQSCSFDLNNTGLMGISGVDFELLVINVDSQQEYLSESYRFDLSTGATVNQIQSFSTLGYEVGVHACVLKTELDGEIRILDSSIFEVEIPALEISVEPGTKQRALVLTDAPRQCSAFEDIRLGAEFGAELSLNNEITVRLLNDEGVVLDTEVITAFDLNINQSYGTPTEPDLAVRASAAGELEFILTKSGGMPHNRYQVEVKVKKSWLTTVEKSWSIDSSCDRPLTIGELYEDLTLLDWEIWTSDSDLRDVDPYGPTSGPDLNTQNDFIKDLLDTAGWEYTLVHTPEDFAYEHRTGDYGSYLILSERPQLHWKVQKEIREAVVSGKGLLVAGAYDKRNHWLEPALGMDVVGHHPWARELNTGDDFFTASVQVPLAYQDRVQGIWLDGASVIGEYTLAADQSKGWTWLDQHSFVLDDILSFKRKAITQYEYGDGRSLFFGFDLLLEASAGGSQSAYSNLLRESIDWIQPTLSEELYPGSVLPVDITWTNNRGAVDAYTELSASGGATIVDADDFAMDATPIAATFSMGEGEVRDQTVYVELSSEPTQQLRVATTTVDGDQRMVQAEALLDLNTTVRPSLEATQSELDSLAWQYWYRVDYRSAWLKYKLARSAFEAGYYNEAQGLFLIAADLLMDSDEPDVIAARKSLYSHIETTGRQLALDQ
ncbi:MAG: carboxypeptidase regulatory-like domain-containing protein [Pseudomonadota bacterium]|nr:carboxypeptidase regulatory-like domain-containing protein [Pseudomonadota bacterium]